jgi:hypothetical protein
MSKQWQPTTRGGHQYRITTRDPDSDFPMRGEVEDSGCVVCVQWTEDGRAHYDPLIEHEYDLIPLEPEAPSPAKARVDLALAAINYRRACEAMEAARESVGLTRDVLVAAVKQRGRDPVVVKIDGLHFLFEFHDTQIEFSEIEVL